MGETAPKLTCGWCGSEIYAVGKPAYCPNCKSEWKLAEWYKPPLPGSEKYLKYHPIKKERE